MFTSGTADMEAAAVFTATVDVWFADATGLPFRSTAIVDTSSGTAVPSGIANARASTLTLTTLLALDGLAETVTSSVSGRTALGTSRLNASVIDAGGPAF